MHPLPPFVFLNCIHSSLYWNKLKYCKMWITSEQEVVFSSHLVCLLAGLFKNYGTELGGRKSQGLGRTHTFLGQVCIGEDSGFSFFHFLSFSNIFLYFSERELCVNLEQKSSFIKGRRWVCFWSGSKLKSGSSTVDWNVVSFGCLLFPAAAR